LLKNFLFLLFCMFRLRDLRFRMFLNSSTHWIIWKIIFLLENHLER
jgi:hypothetical protein